MPDGLPEGYEAYWHEAADGEWVMKEVGEPFIEQYVGCLGARERRWLLWDQGEEAGDLKLCLAGHLAASAAFGLGWLCGKPCALSWLFGISAKSAFIHFHLSGRIRGHARAVGAHWLEACRLYGYESLICMIPWRHRAARAFARDLGFAECGVLRKAARLGFMDGGKYLDDGVILILNFQDGMQPENCRLLRGKERIQGGCNAGQ